MPICSRSAETAWSKIGDDGLLRIADAQLDVRVGHDRRTVKDGVSLDERRANRIVRLSRSVRYAVRGVDDERVPIMQFANVCGHLLALVGEQAADETERIG